MSVELAAIEALLSAGRLAEARQLADQACAEAPEDAMCWYLGAAVSAQAGQWDDVARFCARVVALLPDHLEARFNLAAALARLQRHAEAADAFAAVLARDPAAGHACFGLAVSLKADGRPEAAIAVLQGGLAASPGNAVLHMALGDTLHQLGRNEEAAASYATARSLDPRSAPIQYGSGCVLLALGRQAEAQACLEAAVALDPAIAGAYGRLAIIYGDLGRQADALRCYEQLLVLDPTNLTGLVNYGFALQVAGRTAEAAAQYRRALTAHPDSELARYFVATLGGDPPPGQAPAAYVKDLFDNYAARFDRHLVEGLQYRTPEAVAVALRAALGDRRGPVSILDLGCGTGLSGAAVRGIASRLVGVDLSTRMLAEARAKRLYDELHEADLLEFLGSPGERFEVVVAADVLVYLGDLRPLFARVATALAPAGLFAFSDERHEGDGGFVLRTTGRYAHSREYIRAAAAEAGLDELSVEARAIRCQAGEPINGDVFVFRRPG